MYARPVKVLKILANAYLTVNFKPTNTFIQLCKHYSAVAATANEATADVRTRAHLRAHALPQHQRQALTV